MIAGLLAKLCSRECGQDTAEYIVMTAVVVGIIIAVVYGAYRLVLQGTVDEIAVAIAAAIP